MRIETTEGGQHPDNVVEAAVRQARRWVGRPETPLLARAALGPFAPRERDPSGKWLPQALWAYSRTLQFWREPPPPRAGEIVTSPILTTALGGGDCDDIAAQLAAFAASLGASSWIGRLFTSADYSQAHILVAMSPSWWPDGGPAVIVDPERGGPISADQVIGIRWAPVLTDRPDVIPDASMSAGQGPTANHLQGGLSRARHLSSRPKAPFGARPYRRAGSAARARA